MAKARRWEDRWLDGGNSPERSLWAMQGPSRRLRKLYKLLLDIDGQIEISRKINYCPEHAPTAWRMARKALAELNYKRDDIVRRINLIQNNGEDF